LQKGPTAAKAWEGKNSPPNKAQGRAAPSGLSRICANKGPKDFGLVPVVAPLGGPPKVLAPVASMTSHSFPTWGYWFWRGRQRSDWVEKQNGNGVPAFPGLPAWRGPAGLGGVPGGRPPSAIGRSGRAAPVASWHASLACKVSGSGSSRPPAWRPPQALRAAEALASAQAA